MMSATPPCQRWRPNRPSLYESRGGSVLVSELAAGIEEGYGIARNWVGCSDADALVLIAKRTREPEVVFFGAPTKKLWV